MTQNKKLKVLLVSPSPPPVGGIQSWSVAVLDYLISQDQVAFNYIDTVAKYRGYFEMGLYKRMIAGIRLTIDVVRAITNTIHESNPSVIHLTSSASLALFKDYLILRRARKFKIPVIIHWHFGRIPDLSTKKNWEWWLIYYLIKKSAYSIVIDDHSYKTLIEKGFKNVINIPNPISIELERKARNLQLYSSERRAGRLVFVGHVERAKGVFELVEACNSISEVKELLIIGPYENDIRDELTNLSRRRENGIWLKFFGSLNNNEVLDHLESASVMTLPSYTEGFPVAIIEAMAMACPVVATNVGAIPEMLNINGDSPSGLCVPVKDRDALKASIKKVLYNKEIAIKYGRNGLNRVMEKYTIDKIFKEYKVVWQTAVENSKL